MTTNFTSVIKKLTALTLLITAGVQHPCARGASTGTVSYTGTITLTAEQTQVDVTYPEAFPNDQYFLYVRAWHEEDMDGKTVQVLNAVYDFSKTSSGFSLKVKNKGGLLNYYAVEAGQSPVSGPTPHRQSFTATQGQARFTLDYTWDVMFDSL